jgi:alcohol dehydrogenase
MSALPPDVHSFDSHLPVRISFGDGAVERVGAIADALVRRNVFVVADEAVRGIDSLDAALAALEASGHEVVEHLKPPGEPTFAAAEELGLELADRRPGLLIAVGGGSALDLAKAARVGFEQGPPLRRYLDSARIRPPALPLVTIPTTSGTGSEVSGGSVLSAADGRKQGIASPNLRAQHALVDPLLTVGLPREQTIQTGVDALAQAIGGVIVTIGNPLSVALGLEACRHVATSLPAAARDGGDLEARRGMSLASLLAGLSMNLSDCSAEHPLGEAIGGLLGLPHGLTVGLLLAETLEINRLGCAARLERVADALREPEDGSGDGTRAVRAVRRLLAELGFPTLRDVGVDRSALPRLVELASADPFLAINPCSWGRAEVARAYEAALALDQRSAAGA